VRYLSLMKNESYTSDDPALCLSEVFEKVNMPDGGGFIGFTLYLSKTDFKNHIEYFTNTDKAAVIQRVKNLHAQYLALCKPRVLDGELSPEDD